MQEQERNQHIREKQQRNIERIKKERHLAEIF